jgi:hypothetical protein
MKSPSSYKRKPKKCPRCKSEKVATILYGFPDLSDDLTAKLNAGKIAIGGCVIEDGAPKWKCVDCQLELGQTPFILTEI